MANFNPGNRGNRGGGFGRRDFRDRGSRGPVSMHKAICDNCGKECQVPFRPTSGKPIFCSSCFGEKKNSEPRNTETGQSQYKEQFEQLNSKLDKILNILLPKK